MLRDITVENYRLFEKFQLEGMTQVNLLVGVNNSGKSSLLEAIYLLVNSKDQGALFHVLDNRFMIRSNVRSRADMSELSDLFQMSNIFRGHKLHKDHHIIISTQKDEPMSLEYTFVESWPKGQEDETGLRVRFRGEKKFDYFFEAERLFPVWHIEKKQVKKSKINKYLVTTERLDQQAITKLWEQIILTPKEDMVLEALRILQPNLERIALVNQVTPEMSVLLKIKDNEAPVPLGSMGDGIYRIFALIMSLVSAEGGVLLVDEIDTGLHYKALIKMWRLVIETAKRLKVQVFATTHSWDCLAAFQKALSEAQESDIGTVFRLEPRNGQIDYVAYSGEELDIAVEHDIEVR